MPTEILGQVSDQPRSLLRGMSWSVLGQVTLAISQWGILLVLVKYLDLDSVGQFAYALALAGPLFAFSNLQLSGILASDQSGEYAPSAYVMLRVLTSLLAFLSLFLLVMVGSLGPTLDRALLLIGLIKLCESASDLIYGFLQQHERIDQVGLLQTVRGGVALVAAWCTVSLSYHLLPVLVVLLICQVLLTSLVDIRALRSQFATPVALKALNPLRAEWRVCRRLLSTAFPMGMVIGLNTLNINLPRYWIIASLGDAAVGVYAALSYVMTGGNMAIGAIGQAAVPRLSRFYRSDRAGFHNLVARLSIPAMAAGLAGIGLAILAGTPLLTTLYNESFVPYHTTFVWVMIGSAILYVSSIAGCALTAARIFRPQVWLTLLATMGTIISCGLLIPSQGLTGAAMAMAIGFSTKLIGQLTVLGVTSYRAH